jgi:hypothetical protein
MASKKRETVFARSYSDKSGDIAISHEGEEIFGANVKALKGGESLSFPSTVASGIMRYGMDVLVSVAGAVMKADGGTVEKAAEKVAETWKALCDGTFKFRSASGSGSLSLEDQFRIIAETVVGMGLAPDVDSAIAHTEKLYNQVETKTRKLKDGTTKEYKARPAYTTLCNITAVKLALEKAQDATSAADQFAAVGFGAAPAPAEKEAETA